VADAKELTEAERRVLDEGRTLVVRGPVGLPADPQGWAYAITRAPVQLTDSSTFAVEVQAR